MRAKSMTVPVRTSECSCRKCGKSGCCRFTAVVMVALLCLVIVTSQAPHARAQTQPKSELTCQVAAVDYKGWKAQQVSNRWVQLIVVPQNGGRLMQVTFDGHPYLFVNQKLAGKYMPPSQDQWFNYGGDKIWLLPEGNDDEQHWRGNSDLIDDGQFTFREVSDDRQCGIELTGPADPQTGVQFIRTIRLDRESPHIAFMVLMKNVTGHTLEWSMQSVSQYDTADPKDPSHRNPDFWGFTPTNRSSAYLNRYHVRFGPAENPAVRVREDGLFSVHYAHHAAELWIDSTEGWLAVVDGNSRYAMVERFQSDEQKPYPGKASVIFWTNGPQLKWNNDGEASLSESPEGSPFYMEAEINSPMCRLRPGEACRLESDWFPTRAGDEFHGSTDAGIVTQPLAAVNSENGKVRLSGAFGVFYPGKLVAHFYDERGSSAGTMPVAAVSPTTLAVVETEIAITGKCRRVSLHLEDQAGLDRGVLQEVQIKDTR